MVDFSGTTGSAGKTGLPPARSKAPAPTIWAPICSSSGINGLGTTVSGTINDGGASGGAGASLVKVGDGTLILSGANTYTGLTAVLGGTLQAGAPNAFASSSAFTVASGAAPGFREF